MPENVYLTNLREQYETLQKSITGLQSRAAEAKRDLTNEELRSIVEMGEKGDGLYTQIQSLSEIELRNAKVSAMADRVNSAINAGATGGGGGGGGDGGQPDDTSSGGDDAGQSFGSDGKFRALGGARTMDRDPGFYTRGGKYSYVSDQYRAMKKGDNAAAERLQRHTTIMTDRAQSDAKLRAVLGAGATTLGAGLVPPVWLAEEFAPVMHKKLRLAAQLRQVPWAGPFAWTIPVAGTVAKTSSTVEGVNTTITNPGYGTITVTPTDVTGWAEVSRQMLEGSNPAVDAIIWGDMIGDFYDNAETLVIAAATAVSGLTATVSAGVLTTTDIYGQRAGLLDGIAAIADAPAGDPDIFAGPTARWTAYLKMIDTTGRPVILAQAYNPYNAIGSNEGGINFFRGGIQGTLESLGVVTSPTIGASTGFILNSQEHLFSISPPMQFSYEQPVGPALVRIGIWGYEACTFSRRPKALLKLAYSGS